MAAPLLPTARALAEEGPPSHRPPVAAEVVDPFRAPEHAWSAGNRGLEYGTAPGAEVRATADGTVAFAGSVAGSLHVTIEHADGVRTTYSFLERIDVVVGQRVDQGELVGVTVEHLHLGARRGDAYFDPATLFASGLGEVHLVPFDEPPGAGERGERSAISQLVSGARGFFGGKAVSWLRDEGARLTRGLARGAKLPVGLAQRGVDAISSAWDTWRRPCTAAEVSPGPPPAGRRVAVLVGGLGSTSERAAIAGVDTEALGYAAADVLRFSYEGGRVPGTGAAFDHQIPAHEYGARATQRDLFETAELLADLVEATAAAAPGAEVDLLAHSQGGLVARLALVELEARHGRRWLERLGLVATLGTPHGGADLATAVRGVAETPVGSIGFDALQRGLGLELDDDAPSVRQLAEGSEVVRLLAEHPIPAGVTSVSIAARGDVVVPVPRTRAPGATQVVVPLVGLRAHDALPGSDEAERELQLALAGQAPTCRSLLTSVVDQVLGEGISAVEDEVGARAALAVGGTPAP